MIPDVENRFEKVDIHRWPWRELHWVWCHPLTTLWILMWPICTAVWAVWDVTR